MIRNKTQNIINQGEGISVEFKTATNQLPNNLFETISAFLNKSGGTILLGVGDDKKIHGVDKQVVDELSKQIANLSNNPLKLFPSFLLEPQIVEYKDKKLISIFVPISSQVHKTSGKIFDRSVDGDFELRTDEQIKSLYQRKSTYYSENTIYPFLKESDLIPEVVSKARKMIKVNKPNHPWNELSNDEFYRITGLFRNDYRTGEEGFTLAAILLFGKEEVIKSVLPHYKIDALVKIKNLDRYDDRDNIRCNLVEAYDRLMSFVEKHLPDKFHLEGTQRISLRDKIFREVIANLLIHREYTNAYPSTFIIYRYKVIAKNANKAHYFKLLTPNNFEPFPKNPDLATVFTQIGYSEELGTGIRNVYKFSKHYSGSDNIIFSEDDVFVTEVPLSDFNEKHTNKNDELNDELNAGQKIVFKFIKNNKNKMAKDISEILNMPFGTVDRHIRFLLKKELIERKGSKKTGGYFTKLN